MINYRRAVTLCTIASAVAGVALGASPSDDTTTTKSASSQDSLSSQREIFADRVANGSSALMQQPKKDQQGNRKPHSSYGMQRFLAQARTTLLNLNSPSLTPEEMIFFEDTLRAIYSEVYGVTVNGLIVTSAEMPDLSATLKDKKNHGLRGGGGHRRELSWNSLGGFSWFDFSAVFEVSCTLCVNDDEDDDDFFDRKLSSDFNASKDDDLEEMNREKLNKKLCEALRAGPYENFWEVKSCQVIFG